MKKIIANLFIIATFIFLVFNNTTSVSALESKLLNNAVAVDDNITDDNTILDDNNDTTDDDTDNDGIDDNTDTNDNTDMTDDSDFATNLTYGIVGAAIGGILTYIIARSRRD